jgi:hypothetical protein
MFNDQKTGLKVTLVRTAGGASSSTTAVTGANYRHLCFLIQCNFASTGKSCVVQVEHSDDGVSYSNFGDAITFSGDVALTSGSVIVDHSAVKLYVRALITPSSSAQTSCVAIQFNEELTPDALANVNLSVL